MGRGLLALAVLASLPAPAFSQEGAIWTRTRILHCELAVAFVCGGGSCEAARKLPPIRIDLGRQTLCGVGERGCVAEQKIGMVGVDSQGTRLALHVLGYGLVVGIDANGAMNGAEAQRGRVTAFHGHCRPG